MKTQVFRACRSDQVSTRLLPEMLIRCILHLLRIRSANLYSSRRQGAFTGTLNTPLADGRLIKMEKSDFGGRLTGLIYTLDITLQRDGEAVRVTVDDGDLRNQVVALGLGALFMTMLWPLLLTAGYGWIQKGEIRGAVIAYVAGLLNAQA